MIRTRGQKLLQAPAFCFFGAIMRKVAQTENVTKEGFMQFMHVRDVFIGPISVRLPGKCAMKC